MVDDDVDAIAREEVAAGQLEPAVTRILERYGPELFGFLRAIARDDDLAAEAFALASELLWLNIAAFRWEASLRTWMYQLARSALYRLQREPRRRPANNLPISVARSIEAAGPRTDTQAWRRTEVKEGVTRLREKLTADERELLILRVDRDLSWRDVATVLEEPEPTLRKRFERLKERIKQLAREEKLID